MLPVKFLPAQKNILQPRGSNDSILLSYFVIKLRQVSIYLVECRIRFPGSFGAAG